MIYKTSKINNLIKLKLNIVQDSSLHLAVDYQEDLKFDSNETVNVHDLRDPSNELMKVDVRSDQRERLQNWDLNLKLIKFHLIIVFWHCDWLRSYTVAVLKPLVFGVHPFSKSVAALWDPDHGMQQQ